MTTHTLPSQARTLTRAVWVTIAWFVVVLSAAVVGIFHTPGDSPPAAIGLAVVIPPAIVLWRALRSERFRVWARSLDLRFLTLMQAGRLAGFVFLVLAAIHALPSGFAVPAGLGDVAVGLTAPLVALYLVDRARTRRWPYLAWTTFGIIDLITAVTLGVLHSGTDLMEELPMVLIPAFGVPLTLVLHVISLVNITERAAIR
jgi:hypothetical protein